MFRVRQVVVGFVLCAAVGVMLPAASAQSLQDRVAQYERDQAEIRRLEETRPEREAAERAAKAQDAARRAADEERSAQYYRTAVAHASRVELDRQLSAYGVELFQKHDYDHALRVFTHNIEVNSNDSSVYGWRARTKAALGQFDDAMQDIAQGVRISPNGTWIIYDRADVRFAAGNVTAAMSDLELLMRVEPTSDRPYIQRARFREKQGDLPGALADLLMAKKLEPNDKTLLDDLAVVQARAEGRTPSADAVARRLGPQPLPPVSECDRVASWPGDETRPVNTPGIDDSKLDANAGVAACAAEVRAHPETVRAQFNLGRALRALGKCDDAKALLQTASDGGSGAATYFLADMQNQGSCVTDPDFNPIPLMEKAIEQGNPWSAQSLGKIYGKVADIKKAAGNEAEYSAALKIAHKNHGIAFDIWNTRAKAGDAFAMWETAVYADATGSEFAGYGKFEVIYRCIAHEVTACYQYDTQ